MNIIKIANYIRQNASDYYQDKVGFLNKDANIDELANPLMQYDVVMNEFATGLMNMIGETILNRIAHFENPLAKFKRVTKGLGIDTREIARGIAKAEKFEFTTEGIAKMFGIYTPEIAECFHRLNRREYYPITFSRAELKLALNDWADLDTFVNDVVVPLYEANYIDEYNYAIELIRASVNADDVKTIEIDEVVDDTSAKKFVKLVKNIAKSFGFPNVSNSVYGREHPNTRIIPMCQPEDIAIIIPYELKNDIKVDVLASAFNKDELAFNVDNVTEVDTLGFIKNEKDTENVKYYQIDAIVCDKAWLRIMDDPDNEVLNNQLPTARSFNSYLHVWQTYSTSPFKCVNAIVHEVEETDVPDGYFENLLERETNIDDVISGGN